MFGEAFRDLEDQATGTKIVKDASDRMATAVTRTIDPLSQFARAVGRAANAVEGTQHTGGIAVPAVAGTGVATVLNAAGKVAGSFPAPAAPTSEPSAIEVRGDPFSDPRQIFAKSIERVTRAAGIGAPQADRDAQLKDALKSGLRISDDAASLIGKKSGMAIEGAATGAFTNSIFAPLAKGLGLKTSKTGAQVGGAIGGMTGIPGGDIIGSIAGSVIGGAFKKTKSGGVTLTSIDEAGSITGNDKASKKAASALADSVIDSIAGIAEQLGADVGSFDVKVGQRHGDYRVTTGDSLKKNKGALDFDDDAAAATEAAVRIAITQGAITGLSAAVQRAIQGSTDLEKALQDALAVQQLETALDGIGGELKATFRAAEQEAANRLQLARKYGIDILKVEELNAQKRADLLDDVLTSRLGSLQALLSDLSFGDLAEGSPAEQRQLLLGAIGDAFKQAQDGVEGASDKYAELNRQLIALTGKSFGTAGPEYAGDRANAAAGAMELIRTETDRAKTAQEDARKLAGTVEAGNKLANETNALLSVTNARIASLPAEIAAALPSGVGAASIYDTSRLVDLR